MLITSSTPTTLIPISPHHARTGREAISLLLFSVCSVYELSRTRAANRNEWGWQQVSRRYLKYKVPHQSPSREVAVLYCMMDWRKAARVLLLLLVDTVALDELTLLSPPRRYRMTDTLGFVRFPFSADPADSIRVCDTQDHCPSTRLIIPAVRG